MESMRGSQGTSDLALSLNVAMSSPEISVVIAAHNAGRHLGECLESVLRQGVPDLEVILVDDGSADDTCEVAGKIADPRLRLILQANQGQSAALNVGIAKARGRYIKIVDADDVLGAEHISSQLAVLAGAPECIASCQWAYFRDRPDSATFRKEATHRDYADPLEWLVDSLSRDEGMMGGWMWLIPRRVLDRSGAWDSRLTLNNDFDFSIRVVLASRGIRFAPGAKYYYRKGLDTALSSTGGRRAMESAYLTTELGCRAILAREDSPRTRRICADRFQEWLYRFYPAYPDLAMKAETHVRDFGGSFRELEGGAVLRLLRRFLTWRQVRWLQHLSRRMGWRWVLRQKQAQYRQRGAPASADGAKSIAGRKL